MDKSPKEYTELTPAKSIYTSTQDILQETYFHEKQNYYHPYVISPSTYRQVESLGNEYIPDKDIPSPTLPSKNRKSLDRSSNEYALRRERNNLAVRRSRERSKIRFEELRGRELDLTKENETLDKKCSELQSEIDSLKNLLMSRSNVNY
nr:CCAAT/enhancer-binding protein beta-like [Lepeophtheirus salmonis]